MLSAVTLWTGVVFWSLRRRAPGTGSTVLAITFTLWGLHHLDYPLLRALGNGVLYGVFADVLFIVAATLGTLFLVLGDGRRTLEERNAQLAQLTRQLLSAQEDERRRIARELHDEAGQLLTAAKIQLDLEGRREASELVGQALAQVRDVSNLLRPSALDDLGLVPALRGLLEDFGRRARIDARLDVREPLGSLTPELQVVIYRIVQEALTNVARHADARTVRVGLGLDDGRIRLAVEDDGRGVRGEPVPNLGLLGIRERVTALGGSVSLGNRPERGFRVEAVLPRRRRERRAAGARRPGRRPHARARGRAQDPRGAPRVPRRRRGPGRRERARGAARRRRRRARARPEHAGRRRLRRARLSQDSTIPISRCWC